MFLLTREHLGQACFSQLLGPDSSKESQEVGTSWIPRTTGWWKLLPETWEKSPTTDYYAPHCASSVVALGTTKHSHKNMYVSFSLSSMNSNSSHSSLLDVAPLGIPGQKGQTPANHWLWAYLSDQEVGEQSCTFWFWSESACALVHWVTIATPTGCCSGQRIQRCRKPIPEHLSFGHLTHIGISQYTAPGLGFFKKRSGVLSTS